MAEKKPTDESAEQRPIPADAAEQMRDADAGMVKEDAEYRAALEAIAIDDSPEARASAEKMHAAIAKATETHESRMEDLRSARMKALEGLDTEHYFAKPWKGMIRYQCAHCYRDASSEEAIKAHQALDHKQGLGPVVMDREGQPLPADQVVR